MFGKSMLLAAHAAAMISGLGGSPIANEVRPSKRKKPVARHVSKMDEPSFREHWRNHPGRNPRYNGGGNRYFQRSRWVPHTGAKEMARYANL